MPEYAGKAPRMPQIHNDASLIILVRESEVLIKDVDGNPILPAPAQLAPWIGQEPVLHLLGGFGAGNAYALQPADQNGCPSGFRFVPVRSLFGSLDPLTLDLVGKAIAIAEFETTHRFCGRCGAPMVASLTERAKRCPDCALSFYPRIPPAVITMIAREGRLLLARSSRFKSGVFSAVAGFVEVGESLEQAAIREVREEVGVEIGGLRYFGSQPWPFGRSLMVGFFAEHLSGEIVVDGEEIVEAHWFDLDRLPLLPTPVSIARKMIDAYIVGQRAGSGVGF
jgi:NAD+ diphosphatase